MSSKSPSLFKRKIQASALVAFCASAILAIIFSTITLAVEQTSDSLQRKEDWNAITECTSAMRDQIHSRVTFSYSKHSFSLNEIRSMRVFGPKAKECESVFKNKLSQFGLKWEDFVCNKADGYRSNGIFLLSTNDTDSCLNILNDATDGDFFSIARKSAYDKNDFKPLDDYIQSLLHAHAPKDSSSGGSSSSGLTDAEMYQYLLGRFREECTTDQTPQFGSNMGNGSFSIIEYNPDTKKMEIATYKPKGGSITAARKITVPLKYRPTFGVSQGGQEGGSVSEGKDPTCADIEALLSNGKYVSAYNKNVKKLKEAGQEVDTTTSTTKQGSDEDTKDDPCFSQAKSIGWIVCPVFSFLADALSWAYESIIEPFLVIDSAIMDSSGATHEAWSYMIGFANIAVVILLLVVIFSQITGVGISNYGIKRSLPKVILAAVLINASFVICQLAVDISNILGNSLQTMFTSIKVGSTDADPVSFFQKTFYSAVGGIITVGASLAVTTVAATTGGGFATGVLLPAILLFVAGLVSLLFLLLLLGVRKAGVILLVAISPLAFACYMLPNTRKLFDKWLKAFQGLLILYPICGLLIGGSGLASRIVLNANKEGNGIITAFVGSLILIAPYFFIPTLLKGSFAAMGNLGAKISGFGKGLSSRANQGIRNTEAYRRSQEEGARIKQQRSAQRLVNRLNRRRKDKPLSNAQTRRLARGQETLQKLEQQDQTAHTALATRDYEDSNLSELSARWNRAFDDNNKDELNALTNVMITRYGAGAAKDIADSLAKKDLNQVDSSGKVTQTSENARKSMSVLRKNMNENSSFANSMRSKAGDAFQMISDGGGTGLNSRGDRLYGNLSHFSGDNKIVTSDKDWATQSSSALQRAIDSGTLKEGDIDRLLKSEDPSIKSSLLSDKNKLDVLQAAKYNWSHPQSAASSSISTDQAAQLYRQDQQRIAKQNQPLTSYSVDELSKGMEDGSISVDDAMGIESHPDIQNNPAKRDVVQAFIYNQAHPSSPLGGPNPTPAQKAAAIKNQAQAFRDERTQAIRDQKLSQQKSQQALDEINQQLKKNLP